MMKTLFLIRHAKASKEDIFPGDFFRTLDKSGYKEAGEIAQWLSGEEELPQLFISSPAVRAYTTALIFASRLSYPSDKIALNASIYDAEVNALMNVIAELDRDVKTVALFGHNPGFTHLVNLLCGDVLENLPTAGIAAIALPDKNWNAMKPGEGKVIYIEFP